MFLHVLTDVVELKFVVVGVPQQWPFQLAAVGPQSVRTRVPQKVWSYRPLLLCPVSLFFFITDTCMYHFSFGDDI